MKLLAALFNALLACLCMYYAIQAFKQGLNVTGVYGLLIAALNVFCSYMVYQSLSKRKTNE